MIDCLEELLLSLRPAFSRQAAFGWSIIAVAGFLMRTDTYGVSSIIRALCLEPLCYPRLVHFFHSSAWDIPTLLYHWWLWLVRQGAAYTVNDRIVFPFSTMSSQVYDTVETVKYLVLDLLWKPAKTTVRFVLVESSHGRIIIMSSDLKLSAQSALFLYCRRASKAAKNTLAVIEKFVVLQIIVQGLLQLLAANAAGKCPFRVHHQNRPRKCA